MDVMWIFLFKEKTAYEMAKGGWSSDVCSSDLAQTTRVSRWAMSRRKRQWKGGEGGQRLGKGGGQKSNKWRRTERERRLDTVRPIDDCASTL